MGSLETHEVVEDCLGILRLYRDGSISRTSDDQLDFTHIPLVNHDDPAASVVWKDCLYDETHNIKLRLYKPPVQSTTTTSSCISTTASNSKMIIIFFFHGGGFCLGSRTWPNCHNSCLRLSSGLQALVIAPDYRLAPEFRLPAAIDDAVKSIKWLQEQAKDSNKLCEDSFLNGVDYERVFVIGDSSGGNMAHHLALSSLDVAPVKVRAYVLIAPFFGGTLRTKSEAEGPDESFLNMDILDRFWRLSLPIGESADHPLANPFGPFSQSLEPMKLDPLLVIVGGNELLKDRVENYARKLKDLNKDVHYVEFQGMQHGFFTNDPFSQVSNQVIQAINFFICRNSGQ